MDWSKPFSNSSNPAQGDRAFKGEESETGEGGRECCAITSRMTQSLYVGEQQEEMRLRRRGRMFHTLEHDRYRHDGVARNRWRDVAAEGLFAAFRPDKTSMRSSWGIQRRYGSMDR